MARDSTKRAAQTGDWSDVLDLHFQNDRGEHELTGIPGRWSLFAAA